MFILRPSSPLELAEPKPALDVKIIDSVEADEHFVDTGLPVPATYDRNIIRAMIQDPFRIFIYWEVREESLAGLTRYFSPDEARGFRVVLKMTEIEGGNEAFFQADRRGRYWMMVFPDREYIFEIGLRSPLHGYISLIRSNGVRTPRGTVSPVSAEQSEYRVSPLEFGSVLEASGFAATQSLDITIAALPGANAGTDQLAATLSKLPRPVREAVTIAGTGSALTAEHIDELPEPLRGELFKLLMGSDGRVASAGLMHYLPELLRELIEDEREWIGDHFHPLHIGPRFFLGGSENFNWPGGEIRLPRLPGSGDMYTKPDASSGSGLLGRHSDT